ncbi:hypothetical protein OAA06_01795 [bacterium]|nr:hypothetical protein [bacterium]
MRKWIIGLFLVGLIAGLYIIELSKIDLENSNFSANLDRLETGEAESGWESFYRVRATLIDGQSASFSIPQDLQDKKGKILELTGAAVFYGSGCILKGDSVLINDFFLLPSLGFAEACVLQPDEAMRWTIRINTKEPWLIRRIDMIGAMVKVKGVFRIDTSKPYESAFFIDDAAAELVSD